MNAGPLRRSWFVWCGSLAVAASCDFDFDAYDPRAAASSSAGGFGGSTSVTGGNVASSVSSTTGGSGGMDTMGGAAGTAGAGGSGGALACTQKYGSLPGFVLCEVTSSTCTFNADHGQGASCTNLCRTAGGSCITCYTNGRPDLCVQGGMKSCDATDSFNDICVCTL